MVSARPPDSSLLARFLSGECTQLEELAVQAWLREDPAHEEELRRLGAAWAQPGRDAAESRGLDVDAFWTELRARINEPAPHSERRVARLVPTAGVESRRRWWIIPSAAAALVLVAAGRFLWRDRPPAAAVSGESPPMREVATGPGQRAEVKLGDGSAVILGVKSRLRFPTVLARRSRELHLEGEAYFIVTRDSTRPFIVHAAGSKTVDLGTAFVLRAYAAERRVQVVVTEGRVALGADRPGAPAPTEIGQGELGQLALGGSVPMVTAVDTSAYTAWLRGQLVFNNTPLADVITELGRWHKVEIQLGDPSLAREELTATFIAESLEETLRTLSTPLQLRVERRGTTVVLRRGSP